MILFQAVRDSLFIPIKAGRVLSEPSHLLYTDDVILFGRGVGYFGYSRPL